MDKELLYVVLPCYNEAENIPNLISSWIKLENRLNKKDISLQIVLVNDGSDKATFEIVSLMEKLHHNVKALHHIENKGLGEALNTGINYVLAQNKNGLLCIMDGDMTHPPEYIFSMLDKLRTDKQDCIIASRYRKGSRVEGLNSFRKLLSFGARILYTLRFRILGDKGLIRDYTCGYRLYKVDMLSKLAKRYNENIITEQGFACMVELLVKISRNGFKVCEVPFTLKYHLKGGQSKMKVFRTIYRSLYLMMTF